MTRPLRPLDVAAAALCYPTPATPAALLAGAAQIRATTPALSGALQALAEWLADTPRGEAEERYSRQFDLSPVCTLDVGYHLFGEQYERGAFLAGMVGELRSAGVAWHPELPDHLPVLLRLLGRMADPEDRRLLADMVLLPAVEKILAALGDGSDLWMDVLAALPPVIEAAVPAPHSEVAHA